MYTFGTRSKKQYNTLHPDLQLILDESIKIYDYSILQGLRTEAEQKEMFKTGRSKLDGVTRKSKHQGVEHNGKTVSMAVDLMPYKRGTNAFSGRIKDKNRFYFMMGIMRSISERLLAEGKITHRLRFGLDWDGDDIFEDQSFDDLPHMELIKA